MSQMTQRTKRDHLNAMPFKDWVKTQVIITDDDKAYVAWVKANPFDPSDDLSVPMFLRRTQSTIRDQWAKAPPPKPMPSFIEPKKPAPETTWMTVAEVVADQKKRAHFAKAGAEAKAERDRLRAIQGPRKTDKDRVEQVRALITRPGGATTEQMAAETGRQPGSHSGFIGILRKEGLNIEKVKGPKGETIFRLGGSASPAPAPAAPAAPARGKGKAATAPEPKEQPRKAKQGKPVPKAAKRPAPRGKGKATAKKGKRKWAAH